MRDRVGDPAQRPLVLTQLLLCLLEGVDIRACPVPSDDLARVVAYRLEPSQDPAKRPIMATKASLELTALTRRHDLGPLLAQLRKVFGVNRRLPSLPPGLVCRDTCIVLPTLVHEFVRAVGELAPGDRRDGVENRSTLRGVGVCGPRIRSVHARRILSLRSLRPYGFAHSLLPQPALLDGDVKQAGQPALGIIPSPRAQVP